MDIKLVQESLNKETFLTGMPHRQASRTTFFEMCQFFTLIRLLPLFSINNLIFTVLQNTSLSVPSEFSILRPMNSGDHHLMATRSASLPLLRLYLTHPMSRGKFPYRLHCLILQCCVHMYHHLASLPANVWWALVAETIKRRRAMCHLLLLHPLLQATLFLRCLRRHQQRCRLAIPRKPRGRN